MPPKRNNEQHYFVEKIQGRRVKYKICKVANGKLEYFIKWEGWDEKNNTWEPLTNLFSCIIMIAEYENE